MDDAYGVYPDGLPGPVAVFQELEDAIAWGLDRFGQDRFAIRHCPLTMGPPLRGGSDLMAS